MNELQGAIPEEVRNTTAPADLADLRVLGCPDRSQAGVSPSSGG